MKGWLRVFLVLTSLVVASANAQAGNNNTYCVGARGECDTAAVNRQHDKWHFHTPVTDGKACYECYDEVDSTCETTFLRSHPDWSTISRSRCRAIGLAPQSEGVVFHVIGGRETVAAKPKKPPRKKKVTLTTEVYRKSPGPYAVGDEVTFHVMVRNSAKDVRAFSGGEIVIRDPQGNELLRAPVRVKGGSAKTASVTVKVPAGELDVQFEANDPTLRSDEVLAGFAPNTMGLIVGSCRYRGALTGPPALVLIGETLDVVGSVQAHSGGPARASELAGARLELLLQLDGGLEARFPAVLADDRITGTIKAPDIDPTSVKGVVSVVSEGEPVICPGASLAVTISKAPFALTGTAPETCWTDLECAATFTVGVGTGPAAAKARELLSQPELEVIAKIGGDRVPFEGTPAGGTITLRTTPGTEGRVTFSVELLSRGESTAAQAQSDVAEAIRVQLPEEVNLGAIGGGDLASTCQPLDFSGSNGAMGAVFSVELADPCPDCEARLVTLANGLQEDLPLRKIIIGKDQVLPICLVVGRCPTGEAGGEQTLLIKPLEARFAGQETRVRVRYSVAGKGSFACWGWLLWWALGGLGLIVIWYGFRRPQGFPPGASVLLAQDQKKLRRAAKVLLEDQPGGRKGWYRSARVYFTSDGAVTTRRSEAAVTFVPAGGGVGAVTRTGLLRRDPRTRKMEPVEPLSGDASVVLSRSREYEAGSLVLKLG